MKYALYRATATNIGEEIQSIAAKRFLPTVDYYIVKEQMDRFQSEEKTKLIMNAWYSARPGHFPPRDCIDPLLVSMHFSVPCRDIILSKKETVEFFKKHGPVGCRDLSTQKWLDANSIPAYFSGCLTSTLLPNERLREKYPEKYILLVNCYNDVIDYVRQHADYPVYSVSKWTIPGIDFRKRMDIARTFLFMFQNAHCVITTNLHTAIPCLAFHTNVCLLERNAPPSWTIGRFDGMGDWFNSETTERFLAGAYDFNNPIENPKAFEKYRDALVEKCTEFTGYDSKQPALEDDFNPAYAMLSAVSGQNIDLDSDLTQEHDDSIRRVLYSARRKDLLKMFLLKTIRRVNEHDIRGDKLLQWSEFFKK